MIEGPRSGIGGWAARLAMLSLLALSCNAPTPVEGPWNDWTVLRLKAKAAPVLTGKVEIRRGEREGRRWVETSTVARVLGTRVGESRTETRIDPVSGKTERFVSLTPRRGRLFTFGESNCTVEQLDPVNGADAPVDQWETTASQQFDYPTDGQGLALPVFDYYGMLLHLRRLDLRKTGDEATVHVLTSDGPVAYRIVVRDQREQQRSFRVLDSEETRTLAVHELRLQVIPADPERGNEGFLRMEGETEIWVEAESKTLLELRGKAPKVPGRVEIVLDELG